MRLRERLREPTSSPTTHSSSTPMMPTPRRTSAPPSIRRAQWSSLRLPTAPSSTPCPGRPFPHSSTLRPRTTLRSRPRPYQICQTCQTCQNRCPPPQSPLPPPTRFPPPRPHRLSPHLPSRPPRHPRPPQRSRRLPYPRQPLRLRNSRPRRPRPPRTRHPHHPCRVLFRHPRPPRTPRPHLPSRPPRHPQRPQQLPYPRHPRHPPRPRNPRSSRLLRRPRPPRTRHRHPRSCGILFPRLRPCRPARIPPPRLRRAHSQLPRPCWQLRQLPFPTACLRHPHTNPWCSHQ